MANVEYWLIALDQLDKAEKLKVLLSRDEIERSQQFKFADLQRRFIVGRGVLRQILGQYLKQDPQDLAFSYGNYGKPFLKGLSFNFSHTKEFALCAVTSEESVQLGVDLEEKTRSTNSLELAKRFFHPKEFSYLEQVGPDQQSDVFLQFWTAKEAYLKALGIGLQGGLNSFQVSLTPNPQFVDSITQWSLKSFQPNEFSCGAIAINSGDCHFVNNGLWNY